MFDVVRFLNDYGIAWYGKGENVSRNKVGVACPFCGDTYNHLGLDKRGNRAPYCWKCGSHTWFSYIRRVTGENPKDIIGRYGELLSYESSNFSDGPRVHAPVCNPPGSKDFKPAHIKYIQERGFDSKYMIRKYDLRVTGAYDKYPFRIIVPIYYRNRIVSYQGRAYTDVIKPKYKTCAPEEEVIFHKDIFFNLDNSTGNRVIIVEGVFDVFALGQNAIASFGTAIMPQQLNMILSAGFSEVFMLYDPEEEAQKKALAAATTLSSAGLKVENIVLDSGDPGDLSEDDALHLKSELGVI